MNSKRELKRILFVVMFAIIYCSITNKSNAFSTICSKYKVIENKYIIGISAGTLVSNTDEITQDDISFYIKDKTLTQDDVITTGTSAKIDGNDYTIIICGDLNCDGKITSTDLMKSKMLMTGQLEDEILGKASDLNADEKITGTDILLIKQILVEIITEKDLFYEERSNNQYKYEIDKLTDFAIITGVTDKWNSNTIEIPTSVDNKTVIGIEETFEAKDATIIKIPETIEFIDINALIKLSTLNKIEVSEKNNYYTSIDGVLYNKQGNKIIFYPPKLSLDLEYAIGDEVIEIGKYAFYNNSTLEKIHINGNVEKINKTAFQNCQGTIYITENLKQLFDSLRIKYEIEEPHKQVKFEPYTYTKTGTLKGEYKDSSIEVKIETMGYINVAKIWIKDPSSQIKKAEAGWNKQNKTLVNMLKNIDGLIVGCNGSFFYDDGSSWSPSSNSQISKLPWKYTTEGHSVISNGEIRRNLARENERATVMGIDKEGQLMCQNIRNLKAEEMISKYNIVNTFGASTVFIENGIETNEQNRSGVANDGRVGRTLIRTG